MILIADDRKARVDAKRAEVESQRPAGVTIVAHVWRSTCATPIARALNILAT